MKVLFLDFDGVLNSAQSYTYRRLEKKHSFKAKIFQLLSTICWMIAPPNSDKGLFRRLIHTLNFFYFEDFVWFCPVACANVQYVLDKIPDLKIVISSVWKGHGLKRCKRVLDINWIDSSRVIGLTPAAGGIRGNDIQAWLNEHPEVKEFVIIDDDADMGHLITNLVQTDGYAGFMFRDRCRVLEKFNESW